MNALRAPSDLFGAKQVGQSRPLRPYQTTAIRQVFAALRAGKRRVVLQIPTAGGKTRTAAEMIRLGMAKYAGEFPCIFTVPRIQLIDQTVDDFEAEGIYSIGVIQGDNPRWEPDAMVQVACIPSLARRKRLPPAKLVIVDECHMRSEWLERKMHAEWSAIPVIGLSATPWTAGMGKVWDELVIATTTAELIEQEHLSKFRLYAPTHPDLSRV
jgi:DNA repair protein RadD